MSGHLIVVGLGPGDPRYLTPDAEDALAAAEAIYGYGPYLDRVPARPGQTRHRSDNREEGARAAAALHHAANGANVAVVSAGDPGVLYAAPQRAQIGLGWQPRFPDLESIVRTAWAWHRAHPHGYRATAHS